MLKKLVALTLAALMLINPMTAMAVSWGDMLVGLEAARLQSKNSYSEDGVTLEVEGTNAKIYGDGLLTDFYQVDDFTSYEFSGSITIGGECFEVYVRENQQVVVNIESGVGITAQEVRFGVDDGATLTVTSKANIETGHVALDVSEDTVDGAELVFINEGSITSSDNIWMGVDGEGYLKVTNNGSMAADTEIGMHAYGNGEGEFTNNGEITTNMSGADDDGNQLGFAVHGEGSVTAINGEDGVVNGQMTGWLDNDAAGGSLSMTNQGTVNGNVGAWGFEGYEDEEGNYIASSGSIELENQGTIEGSFGTNSRDDISLEITNSGTVEGEMFAHNEGSQDMTVTNEGTVGAMYASNNSEATSTVTNSGTVSGNFGVEAGNGTLNVTNSGTIDNVGTFNDGYDEDGNPQSWPADVNIGAYGEGTVNMTNSGTIKTEEVYIYSHNDSYVSVEITDTGSIAAEESAGMWGDGTIEVSNSGVISTDNDKSESWYDEYGDEQDASSLWGDAYEGGSITFTNEAGGEITGYVGMGANGEGTSLDLINNGTTEYFQVNASDGAVSTITNNNTITVQMTNTADSGGTSISTNAEGAYAEWMWSHAEEGGNLVSVNNGTAGSQGGATWSDDATISITNNNVVTGSMDAYVYGDSEATLNNSKDATADSVYAENSNGSIGVTNEGTVDYKLAGIAFGEGNLTVTNAEDAVVGDGEQNYDEEGNEIAPDGVWGGAYDGASVTVTNEGTINGEIGGGANGEGSSAVVTNSGTADTAWVDAHGGELSFANEGTMKGTLSVSIGTQSSDVTSVDTVAALLEQTGINISGYETVDIYTVNQDGEMIARYSVDENGEVTLEEVLLEEEKDYGPDVKSEEQIRHEMEEKRKAAEIGGVFGSPYWLKQLYLGYMSLDLRLFSGEDQILFKENLSWVPGTGKAGEKVLTLNTKVEDTSELTMRLDGMVIKKLDQADITVINIVDAAGNLFMTYNVEDLKDARELYGLTEAEYIVVGSADADVMKIAEDGTISPIEGETEPAEEVADEANKAETEAAVEEIPAA